MEDSRWSSSLFIASKISLHSLYDYLILFFLLSSVWIKLFFLLPNKDIIYISLFCDFDSGTDVAGEVVDFGSQVKDFKVGDKVIAKLNNQVSISFFYFFVLLLISSYGLNFKCKLQHNFMNMKWFSILYIIFNYIRSHTHIRYITRYYLLIFISCFVK